MLFVAVPGADSRERRDVTTGTGRRRRRWRGEEGEGEGTEERAGG